MSERSPTANADRPYISLHFAVRHHTKMSEGKAKGQDD